MPRLLRAEVLLGWLSNETQNHCRKMKMRCVGAEEPPCKRCRNSGLECVMEKPGKPTGDGTGEEFVPSSVLLSGLLR